MGFNPFKNSNIPKEALKDLSGGEYLGLAAHNSLLQTANSSFGSSVAWGAGVGAAYGAVDGGLSYDGSIVGGAFHGAMLGSVGGAAIKYAADNYAKGALHTAVDTASIQNNLITNSWSKSKQGVIGGNAFRFGNFSTGFTGAAPTP